MGVAASRAPMPGPRSWSDRAWQYVQVPGDVTEVDYAIPWSGSLAPSGEGRLHTVGELLPKGFARYLRIFHPFVPWDAEPSAQSSVKKRMSWEGLAVEAGVPFGPTLTWRQLKVVLPISADESQRPWAVWVGDLEKGTADALFESLDVGGGEGFFFAFGLAAILGTHEHGPMMFRADSLDSRAEVIERVREAGAAAVTTPQYVWPKDQAWIVCSDYDLDSTYVAAGHEAALRVLHHPVLEAVEVQLETRIDGRADEQGSIE